MKFFLLIIFFIAAITLLFLGYSFLGGRCLPHRLVAQKIPKYKNVADWSLHVGGSDMGGCCPCGAEIYFQPNESRALVFSFYK